MAADSSVVEALTKALVNSTLTGEKTYRSQSGELVTNTVLQVLSGLMTK